MAWRKKANPVEDPTSLGNLLLRAQACTPVQLQKALEAKNANDLYLGETMVKLGFISRETLVTFLNKQMLLRDTDSRHAVRVASAAVASTLQFSGSLDVLNDLALEVLHKLK